MQTHRPAYSRLFSSSVSLCHSFSSISFCCFLSLCLSVAEKPTEGWGCLARDASSISHSILFLFPFFSPFQLNLDSHWLSCLKSFIPLHKSYCMSWPVNFPRSPTERSCESGSFLVVFCCWALKGKPPTLRGSYRAVPLAGRGKRYLARGHVSGEAFPMTPRCFAAAARRPRKRSWPRTLPLQPEASASPCSSSPTWATDLAHIRKSNSRSQRHFALRSQCI